MSPSALKSFISSPVAQKMLVGFEAEMLVPGLLDYSGIHNGLDMSYDMVIPAGPNWQDEIKNWLAAGNRSESPYYIDSVVNAITTNAANFAEREFNIYIWQTAGAAELAIRLGTALRTADKDKITNNIHNNSKMYQKVKKQMMDDLYNPDTLFPQYLRYCGIRTMNDLCNRYYIMWPYRVAYTSSMNVEDLENSFKEYTGFNVRSTTSYHTSNREPDLWIFEPDGSIDDPTGKSGGIELVSPPMPITQALESMNKFWDWTKTLNIKTNKSCGFHIGVSIADVPVEKLDIVKLALFLGDLYVLKIFDRLNNTYTKSALAAITFNIRNHHVDRYIEAFKQGINKRAYQSIVQSMSENVDEKYMTIRLHGNYIEFRSAGGNYLDNKTTIENTLIRYVKAMAIAADPEAEKEEYAKKIYKLFTSKKMSQNKDTVHLFALYQAGELTLRELKARIIAAQSNRKGPNKSKIVKAAELYQRGQEERDDQERESSSRFGDHFRPRQRNPYEFDPNNNSS
jgi:hypothetical protein